MPQSEPKRNRTVYTILLVEDQDDDVLLTKKAFIEVEARLRITINVSSVENGVEALSYLEAHRESRPDLILADIAMPIMGGIELLKKLKHESSIWKMIPICMLTTSNHDRDICDSYENHCAGYLRKPVIPDEFIELLSQISNFFFNINTLPPRNCSI